MVTHQVKCWPEPFQALMDGRKTAEYRRNDRGYQVGDRLVVREWVPFASPDDGGSYTQRKIDCTITDVRCGPAWGIAEGYAMLSFRINWVGSTPELDKLSQQIIAVQQREISAALEKGPPEDPNAEAAPKDGGAGV